MDVKTRRADAVETPDQVRPLTVDVEPTGPLGPVPRLRRIALSPINQRRWRNFKTNRRGYWSLWVFLALFVHVAVRGIHRQRQAALRALRRQVLLPGVLHLSGNRVWRRLRNGGGLSRSLCAEADRRQRRQHDLAADPLLVRHPQSRPADPGAVEADLAAHRGGMQVGGAAQGPQRLRRPRIQLARHRRSGPRCARPPHLRLPHLGACSA